MSTTTEAEQDLPLFGITDPRAALSGELFTRIAHEIGDGWDELQERARDLQAGLAESAEGAPAFDQKAVVERMAEDPDFDWRRAVADDVRYAETELEVRRRIGIVATQALGALGGRANSWVDAHEAEICERLDAERQRVADKIEGLVPKLRHAQSVDDVVRFPDVSGALAAGVELLRDFDELRSRHLALIKVNSGDRSTWWRGLDWVGNYEDAWGQFYLASGIQVQMPQTGQLLLEQEPLEAPWEITDAVARIRSFGAVTVWTPTQSQFEAAKVRLDRAAVVARHEFSAEVIADERRKSGNSSFGGIHDQSFIRHTTI